MTTAANERREGYADIAAGELTVRAGFRVPTGDLLAGGPVEVEFFVEAQSGPPPRLAVSGDRGRGRPGQFEFDATFEGTSLADPQAEAPYLGGPAGVVEVTPERPWRQGLVLSDFTRLEETLDLLANGEAGLLQLQCRRSLAIADSDAAALLPEATSPLEIELAFLLRRDDAALEALARRLLEEALGPPAERERPLSLLLGMRAAALRQISELAAAGDEVIAARARRALAAIRAL